MFAPIYHCHTHGDVWRVETTEAIDCDRDEVYPLVLCALCHHEVMPVENNGVPVWHVLTDEEMDEDMWADPDDDSYSYWPDDDEEEFA